jgi:hypothetical protein
MKTKLNARGFAHHFILMALIVLTGVAGSYYLLVSHADSCTGTTDPTTGMSDPTCTSDPVTAPLTYSVSCVIGSVPSTVKTGTTINPKITLTNTGTGAISTKLTYHYESSVLLTKDTEIAGADLAAGQSSTVSLPSYVATSKFNTTYKVWASVWMSYTVNGGGYGTSVSCNKLPFNITVPTIASVTINPSDWKWLYHASVVTDSPKGNVLKISSGGEASTSPSGNDNLAKLTNFAQADNGKQVSVCMTARLGNLNTSNTISMGLPWVRNSSYNYALKTNYTKACKTITLPAISAGAWMPPAASANISLGNSNAANAFVDTMTLTLL